MSTIDTFLAFFQLPLATWDCIVAYESSLPDGIVCSISVNSAMLAILLLGAVCLVAPIELKWRGSRRNRMDH
jgi:hypothetical protein